MDELFVVWDGNVQDPDRGSLLVPAHPTRTAPDVCAAIDFDAPVLYQVTAALRDWQTIPDLVCLLHLEKNSVELAVRTLRRRGALEIGSTGQRDVRKRYRIRSVRQAAA